MDVQVVLKTYGNTDLEETEDRPLVTFALLAYNQEKYIREAVEGAFSQTYSPLEIILSDDCSSDRTFEIMEEMAREYRGPHRVVVDRTPTNLGRMAFGRRVWSLLSQCNGELVVLAAGDDVSMPDRTQALFDKWQTGGRKAVCIHSKALPVDERGVKLSEEVGDNRIASISLLEFIKQDGRGLLGATNAVSKELLNRFGPLPDVLLMEDGALAFRARLSDGVLFVPRKLVLYRRHQNNLTSQAELKNREAMVRYARGLVGQHLCFQRDYLAACPNFDLKIITAFIRRIDRANRISRLFDSNWFARIDATLKYSDRFPLKRRIWLLFNSLGLVRGS